jgi:hypothetical protein
MDELKTRAYIPLHSETGQEVGEGLILREPVPGLKHKELVERAQVENLIATIKDEHDERGIDIDVMGRNLRRMERRLEGWKAEVKMHVETIERYRTIMHDIGTAIGRPAHDMDGAILSEPVPVVVRDIVVAAYKPRNRVLRALRMLVKGI